MLEAISSQAVSSEDSSALGTSCGKSTVATTATVSELCLFTLTITLSSEMDSALAIASATVSLIVLNWAVVRNP